VAERAREPLELAEALFGPDPAEVPGRWLQQHFVVTRCQHRDLLGGWLRVPCPERTQTGERCWRHAGQR
jgi:hypothetical protein